MKNRNIRFTAMLLGFVFALALSAQAADNAPGLPMVTIHSTGNVNRGQTGYFVLAMKSLASASGAASSLTGTYVKFSVSGSAIPGVDYVALVSPAFIGSTGYAVISIKTLANPRGSVDQQAYSVGITLESAPGYSVSQPSSAKMLIKPRQPANN